jgi:Fe-S cluster biogenesis protein NfuA
MTPINAAITAEPITNATCRFTVDSPVYPDRAFYFGSRDRAAGSALPERIFAIDGVTSVQVSHDQITVGKSTAVDWPVIGGQIGMAIREFLASGEPAVTDAARESIPPASEIRNRVQQVLDTEINPSVASHGGVITLIDVKDNMVYIQMGGGCQGCGQADVTLKFGIETAIRAAVDGVGDILDVTDHASGRNPYYTPSKK